MTTKPEPVPSTPAFRTRTIRQWRSSLEDIGDFVVSCPFPLSATEREDVLAMMDLIRKQLSREDSDGK